MLCRRRSLVLVAVAIVAAAASASAATALTPLVYEGAVTEICAHAVLFEGTHPIGTRVGALEVAADIRETSRRRLAQVAALSAPQEQQADVARWLAVEQRLADTYARNYVRIYDLIAAPSSQRHSVRAASILQRLLHATDSLRQSADLLEQKLGVPDCVGD